MTLCDERFFYVVSLSRLMNYHIQNIHDNLNINGLNLAQRAYYNSKNSKYSKIYNKI